MRLFCAGPVNLKENIKKFEYVEIGHREPEFQELYKSIKDKLFRLLNVKKKDYSIVLIGGSGTSAMESIISSVLHSNKKTLVLSNGAFGERWAEICQIHNIPIEFMNFGWNNQIDIKVSESFIKRRNIEAVILVHLETSTGVVNPINKIGKLCKKYKKVFIVDAVSSFIGEKLNVKKDNIDYLAINSNKGVNSTPVLGIVCCKNERLSWASDIRPRTFYLDLFKFLKYSEKNMTPTTPPIVSYYHCNEALKNIEQEGLENMIKRYKQNAEIMRKGLKEIGLKFTINKGFSNVVTNAVIPKGIEYEIIRKGLRKRGYIIYPGKGPLDGKVMNIGNIGNLNKQDIIEFLINLNEVLNENNC